MSYQVVIKKKVLKTLESISEPNYSAIKSAIYNLADNPRPQGCKKLKGRTGYRIRKGDFRIIYDILDELLVVDVIAIGNRRGIYE